LALVCAILSSNEDLPIPQDVCFAGEVGLTGEIRPVNRIEQRISEAEKLGFKKIIISSFNLKGINENSYKIKILSAVKMEDVFNLIFR
jgi:DNA repair protein RadA/Sms